MSGAEPSANIGDVVLGRYRLTSVVGRGGVGTVFKATDERLGRDVAVKVLHNRSGLRGAEQRLKREAETLATLTHPNLVTLLDYDVLASGAPAMVMEFIQGVSLSKLLKTYPFTVGEIAVVLHQTLAALADCHEKQLVHRDLKPGNLIVQTDHPDGLRVKLIDFGIVQLLGDSNATALTMNGEVFGSPRYMAPEQWLQQPVGPRTDIYATGIIGYCMVLGGHFIKVRNPVMVFEAHTRNARPELTTTKAGEAVPEALSSILRQATQAEQDARFPDARTMQQALKPLLPGVKLSLQVQHLPPVEEEESESHSVKEVTRAREKIAQSIAVQAGRGVEEATEGSVTAPAMADLKTVAMPGVDARTEAMDASELSDLLGNPTTPVDSGAQTEAIDQAALEAALSGEFPVKRPSLPGVPLDAETKTVAMASPVAQAADVRTIAMETPLADSSEAKTVAMPAPSAAELAPKPVPIPPKPEQPDDAETVAMPPLGDEVIFGVQGGVKTAITKEDVERGVAADAFEEEAPTIQRVELAPKKTQPVPKAAETPVRPIPAAAQPRQREPTEPPAEAGPVDDPSWPLWKWFALGAGVALVVVVAFLALKG